MSGQLGRVQIAQVFGGGMAPQGSGSGDGTWDNVYVNQGGMFSLFNTADQVTNYERLTISWSSNILGIYNTLGGTGVVRALRIGNTATPGQEAPSRYIEIGAGGASTVGIRHTFPINGTSGTQAITAIDPTISQGGTAGYTALDINPTESTTGSGTKLLQRWAVGGSEKAKIDNVGNASIFSLAINMSLRTADGSPGISSGGMSKCDATAGNITLTLGAASTMPNKMFTFKKIDASANTVTIDANAAETIDGALTQVLAAQWDGITIQSDGTAWFVVSRT